MNFNSDIEESAEIPLAPMIDIMFLLLCFFVVSQIHAQYESELDITLPTAESSQPPKHLAGDIVINVKKNGSYVILGEQHSADAIGTKLMTLASYFPGQPVIIRGDRDARHEDVVRILDQCRAADIWNISIATMEPEGP